MRAERDTAHDQETHDRSDPGLLSGADAPDADEQVAADQDRITNVCQDQGGLFAFEAGGGGNAYR